MKKIALVTAAALIASAAASDVQKCYTGFFAGINTGVAFNKGKTNINDKKVNKTSALLGLSVGYNHFIKCTMVGVEVGYNFLASKKSVDNGGEKFTATRKDGLRGNLKLGYMVNPGFVPYISLGAEQLRAKYSYATNSFKAKNRVAFVAGLGFNYFINSNVFANVAWERQFPKTVKCAVKNAAVNRVKSSLSANRLVLGLAYKF